MTAYEPPTIDYFGGARPLQFNPNIYENGLAVVSSISKLTGSFVTILGTISTIITTPLFKVIQGALTTIESTETTTNLRNSISTIITTPLFKVIQGALTTIEATEAYTELKNSSYFKFTAPFMYFSPLGTWSAFTASSIRTSFFNPTLVEVYADTNCDFYAPLVSMKLAGANTSNGFDFRTNTSDPSITTSSIVATGGTTTNTGTLTLTAGTSTIAGTTTNLNSTTNQINGTTTNFNSTGTNAQGPFYIQPSGSLIGVGGGGQLILYDGDACSNTGLTTFNGLNPASNPVNAVLIVQYSKVTATTCNLSTTHRDGFVWYLVNQGQGACTVNYGTANIFGPGLTRGGTNTCSIAVGGARMFRSCLFPSNSINGGFTNGWFTALL